MINQTKSPESKRSVSIANWTLICCLLANVAIKLIFVGGTVFLFYTNHPIAGAWMLVGALISGLDYKGK